MRRDLCYYYERPLDAVFSAFVQAANQRFGKDCVAQGTTLSFGLNYSFKYNMNGGSITAHFMPYQNGTAVDLRYTIVQLAGARYKAHARDLILFTDSILQAQGVLIQLDINQFLAYEQNAPAVAAAVQPNVFPQNPPQPAAPVANVCPHCGKPASVNAKFCTGCGQPMVTKKFCTSCGTALDSDAKFCIKCGAKQE